MQLPNLNHPQHALDHLDDLRHEAAQARLLKQLRRPSLLRQLAERLHLVRRPPFQTWSDGPRLTILHGGQTGAVGP